jgi:sugar O-acyltransferase (sialic acid O-acetyltransferase NeuD family)
MTPNHEGIVVIGAGEQAELTYEYFTHDSDETVAGFAVEGAYLDRTELYGLPVVALEDLQTHFPPDRFLAFVAISSTKLNRVRRRLYEQVKELGYSFATYVSSQATVWHTAKIGENSMIMEQNNLQHGVEVGDNVIMWSANHVGHRARIGSHCFFASHAVIAGFCVLGESCYMAANCFVGEFVKIADDCVIGAGSVVLRDTEPGKVYVGSPGRALDKSSYETFGVEV